jgi:GNAT superfamily N-acetyltransferase
MSSPPVDQAAAMTGSAHLDAAVRLAAATTTAASDALGRELPEGTTVVASPWREGSTLAVAYPLGDRTIIWCAPALSAALASLDGPVPLSNADFTVRAGELGGVLIGSGHHRVLSTPAPDPAVESSRLVVLDRDDPAHRSLISAFIDHCSDDDLDEAELDMDRLDEAIVGVLDDSGALASYASARPWVFDSQFDDIAVITDPDHRVRGLGRAAVAALSQRRQHVGRTMFYSCDVDNLGSNRLAEAVGFEHVYTVTGVSFG